MGVPALLATWGVLIEPRLLVVEHVNAAIPDLPAAWDRTRLAVLADWQVGLPLTNVGTVRKAIGAILATSPAALLLAGDLVSGRADDVDAQIDRVVRLITPVTRARIPTFAVLGNHDWRRAAGTPPREPIGTRLHRALEAAGVQVLRNDAAPLTRAGVPPLYIVGIGAHVPGHDDPQRALAAVPARAPRVVLMHNPASFEDIAPGQAPLAVAGHTHGGQIVIPLVSELYWRWWKGRARVPRAGWIAASGGNHLYVTRGIGMSRVAVRINCPPELTYVTLTAS